MSAGSRSSTPPRFTAEARAANRPVVELLQRVGQRKGASPAQIALAWLLARKPTSMENLGALAIELTVEDVVELEAGFARVRVQGARAPEQLMKSHDIGANLGSSSAGGQGLSPLPAERSR